ncbi:hypothetical protein [Alicycliphilus denitrificans]|uniref:hypothetical protein n=1 Tax=Alicycliphilus denitrificans TaxID=179636 RepID=UPI0001DA020A|nr:hypothetical protein [Alicycliphilus denitrificans]ADU99426.1 hypothetical protein Alide_1671 [Alicycliphilus denitrificans BC]
MAEYDKQVAHLTRLALTPGWWQYARRRALELEADMPGIRDAVRQQVEASGYRPPPEERGEWWLP